MKTIIAVAWLGILASIAVFAAKDPIGGREMLELPPGTYIVTTNEKGGPQIEVTIRQSGYDLTELTSSGTPPFTVSKADGKIEFSTTTVSEGREIVLIDRDGDGIPEKRLTIHRDANRNATKVIVEKITVSFEESGRREIGAEPGATDNPDDAQRLREDH